MTAPLNRPILMMPQISISHPSIGASRAPKENGFTYYLYFTIELGPCPTNNYHDFRDHIERLQATSLKTANEEAMAFLLSYKSNTIPRVRIIGAIILTSLYGIGATDIEKINDTKKIKEKKKRPL